MASSNGRETSRRCARCGGTHAYSGDWYGELCPTCADETEPGIQQSATCNHLDAKGIIVKELKLMVPTYLANAHRGDRLTSPLIEEPESDVPYVARNLKDLDFAAAHGSDGGLPIQDARPKDSFQDGPDFGSPVVPVLVCEAD